MGLGAVGLGGWVVGWADWVGGCANGLPQWGASDACSLPCSMPALALPALPTPPVPLTATAHHLPFPLALPTARRRPRGLRSGSRRCCATPTRGCWRTPSRGAACCSSRPPRSWCPTKVGGCGRAAGRRQPFCCTAMYCHALCSIACHRLLLGCGWRYCLGCSHRSLWSTHAFTGKASC